LSSLAGTNAVNTNNYNTTMASQIGSHREIKTKHTKKLSTSNVTDHPEAKK